MLYCIKLKFSNTEKFSHVFNHCSLHSSILLIKNKELDSSVCESIDKIKRLRLQQEKESSKKFLRSQLTDIDYESYIKQFWVGLLVIFLLFLFLNIL